MKILIGTSGWMYKDWGERFYPEGLKDRDKLQYLAGHFPTVEINSSFYRMPKKSTFKLWHDKAPKGFIFSVKFPRYMTQRKKLIIDEKSEPYLKYFLKNSKPLKEHLGSVLIQLPPNFGYDFGRLEKFFRSMFSYVRKINYKADFSIEFRNASWFNSEICDLLKKYNTAFVISNSTSWPEAKIFTADFSYIRLHGPKALFASSYSNKQLREWARFITSQNKLKRIYVYFNNDQSAKAIDNAKVLQNEVLKIIPAKAGNEVHEANPIMNEK